MPIRVDIQGLRGSQGRFASMRDRGLVEIQLGEATDTARVVEQIYQRAAPRGAMRGGTFARGITANAAEVEGGFVISLGTNDPRLARWLREGTGLYGPLHHRIYPTHERGAQRRATKTTSRRRRGQFSGGFYPPALGPIVNILGLGQGPFFFRSIAGMRANPWEQIAYQEAEPFVERMANQIGQRTADGLTGAL